MSALESVIRSGRRGRPMYIDRSVGRREYQRELMRKRRAALKEAGK